MTKHNPAISPTVHLVTSSGPPPAAQSGGAPVDLLANLAMRLASFEETAIQEFLVQFEPQLLSLFLRHDVPVTEAEDLACLCIEKAVLKIQQYQPRAGKSLTDWVFMIAYNQLKDWARRQKTRPQTDVPLEDIPPEKLATSFSSDDDEDDAEWESPNETTIAINEALAQLTAQDQMVIRLRYFEHVTDNAELAAHLGVKVNAAKTRLSRAMHRLKQLLEKDT